MPRSTRSYEKAAFLTLLRTIADDRGAITLPVDVVAVASKLGLEVEYRQFKDPETSGLLVKLDKDSPFKAVVSSTEHPHRQRFTIAHEIGHWVHKYEGRSTDIVGMVEKRDELSTRGTDREEIWANNFAAALLMPKGEITRLWAKGWPITAISHYFDVSPAAVENRLANLGYKSVGLTDTGLARTDD